MLLKHGDFVLKFALLLSELLDLHSVPLKDGLVARFDPIDLFLDVLLR